MSVRAYRVIEVKTEEESSFNLRDDWKLKDFLNNDADFYGNLNSDGAGIVGVPVKVLQKAVKKSAELGIDEKTVERLKRDIAAAKSNKDEYVDYFCC